MEQPVGSDFHPPRTTLPRRAKAVAGAVVGSLCWGAGERPSGFSYLGKDWMTAPLGSVWLAWVRTQVNGRVLRASARMGAPQHHPTAPESHACRTVSCDHRQIKV